MADIPGAAQAPAAQEQLGAPGGPADVECPICYQEYDQEGKCPRMLQCLHVFCTECLQRIQLAPPRAAEAREAPVIACPLCRHPTPLGAGDALSLPCNSRILALLPPLAFPVATVTQRVVLSVQARDSRFVILPTVSLRVEHMSAVPPGGRRPQGHRRGPPCIQLLAVTLWVFFIMTCVVGAVFGPKLFKD